MHRDEEGTMNCPHCTSLTTKEQRKKTLPGYRTFRCSSCQRIFNERTGTLFNYLEYPTDIVLLVVLWRLRYKLSLRDLAESLFEKEANSQSNEINLGYENKANLSHRVSLTLNGIVSKI
jgi:transposase-like protein